MCTGKDFIEGLILQVYGLKYRGYMETGTISCATVQSVGHGKGCAVFGHRQVHDVRVFGTQVKIKVMCL